MKKDTKKRLAALAIILLFGMSSIAFVVIGIGGQGSTQSDNDQLQQDIQDYVVEQELDPTIRQQIISAGFTLITYYYTEPAVDVYSLPQKYALNTGQPQIIVERIKSNQDSMTISSAQNTETIDNLTDSSILDVLCRTLIVTPLDCVLNQPLENLTSNGTA
jgi:hypothetical protein